MKNNLLLAFHNKQFLYLWLAEIFTQIPVNVFNFILILVIFNLTKSNTAVSVVVLSFTIPAVIFGIPAGVYTDKWNKKEVLIISNFIRALLLVILVFFSNNIYVIYIISFLFGIITQFFIPAETPLIPLIVNKGQLLSANALFGIGVFGSILIAYIISGPFLLHLGLINTLLILAISLILGGLLVSRIIVPLSEDIKRFNLSTRLPFNAFKKEVLEVASIIISTPHILSALLLLALSQILFLIVAAIAPGYANEVLHIKVEEFPILVIAPAAAGIVIGSIIIVNKLYAKRKKDIITVGIFLSAMVLMIMPYGSEIVSKEIIMEINRTLPNYFIINNRDVIMTLAFILGFANALVFIPANTLLQEKTSDSTRGKMYGVLNTFVGIFSFMPILLVGSFADLVGVGSVVMGIGVCLLLIVIAKVALRY